jgi:restriction endonuclease S subunit
MTNQHTKTSLESLYESKSSLMSIIKNSNANKREYFEMIVRECENKVKRRIGYFCKISESDKDVEDENKEGKYNFYMEDQKTSKTDHADFGDSIVLLLGEKTLIKHDNMFSCSKDNVVIELFGEICLTEYLYYYLLSNIDEIQMILNGESTKDIIDDSHTINNFVVDIPSIEDQGKIIDEMDETHEYYELTRKHIVKLDKLIEYHLDKHKNIARESIIEKQNALLSSSE